MSNELEGQLERVVDRMSAEEFDKFMDEALHDPIYKRQLTLAAILYVGVALGAPLLVAWSIPSPRALAGRVVMFLMPIVALAVLYPAYQWVAMRLGTNAEYRLAVARGLISGVST